MLRHKLIHSLVFSLFFLIAGSASAQVYTVAGQIRDHQGNVIPAATVIVLSGNLTTVNTATQPGSPLATIYSDPAGTMVINQTSNPVTTNGLGQFVAYAASGSYVIQAYRNGFQLVTPISITTNGTGCTISGPAGGIVFNNGSGGCAISNVVVVGSSYACSSTGLNAAIAAVEANTNTSGIVDARSCQGTGTISATVTIGAVNKPVRLLIDSGTNWNCTITNNTDCWDVNPNSSFIATGETQTPGGVGGLTLANSASITHEVALLNQGANAGFDIENLTLQPNSSATLSGAAFYMLNPLQVGTVRGVTVAGLPAILMEITETSMGGGAGPINIDNVQLDCETVTGCKPFLEQGVSGAGVMAGINFYGGVLAHPPSGVHIMADLEGISGSGNQCSGVNFWGTQFESSNSTDDGIYINHCTGVRIDATIASAVIPGANFVYIADCAGTSIKCAGASTDGVTITGLNNFDGWTNSINNTISGTVVPTSDTNRPSLYTYHTVGETLTHVFDDYEGIEATIDSNGIYTSSLSTPIFNVGPNASVASYFRVINNINDIFGPGANSSYLIVQNNNAGATAGQGIIFVGDSLTSRFAIKAMTGSGNVTNLGCGGFFAGGQGSATVLDTQFTVCPSSATFEVPVIFPLLADGCLATSSHIMTSTGTPCGSGGGGGVTIATNGTNNAVQTTLNFISSITNSCGLTNTPVNPAATGNERIEATGTLASGCGGSGIASPTAHDLMISEGASPFNLLSMPVDTILQGQGSSTDPIALALTNCVGANAYNTSTHTFVCNALPGNTPAVTHQFLNSYNSGTGVFGQAQPAYSDISGTPTLYYQTFQADGTPLTQETAANFAAGTNMTITPSIVGGVTTLTFTSSATAATAFSAITSATNTTAGMLVGTGASLGVTGSGTIAATTSAALASTPSLCTTGQAPTGILANGNATGCAPTGGTGTVTYFSAGNLNPIFTTAVSTATSTPALSFSLSNVAANAVLAGPTSGGATVPTYRALVAADIPAAINITGNAATATNPQNAPTACASTQPAYGVSVSAWNALCVTTVGVPYGGTGAATFTNHGPLFGSGTSAFGVGAVGTLNQPLLSGGASANGAYGNTPVIGTAGVYGFGASGTADTGISRDSTGGAGYFDFGNGTANDTSGYVQATTFHTTGPNGGVTCPEGTGGSLTPSTSVDVLWCDSTGQRLAMNNHNTGKVYLSGTAVAATANDCPKYAANGFDLVDSLAGCGGLSGLTANVLLKATSSSTAGNSSITDNGTTISSAEPASFGTGPIAVYTTAGANQEFDIGSGNGSGALGGTGNTCVSSSTTLQTCWNGSDVLKTYTGITLASSTGALGQPIQVGWGRAVAQTAAISATTLFATGSATTMYRASASIECTTTSAAATVLVSIIYTDDSSTVQTISSSTAVCTTLGSASNNTLTVPFRAKTGTNIQYSTTIVNTPTYDVSVSLEQLGTN
jgi:hypothetical protein